MMRAGQCSIICACALFFVVFVSSVDASEQEGAYYYDDLGGVFYQPQIRQDENVRVKRTFGIFLKSFADAIGYDVQKRPSVLPIAAAPAAMAPAAPAPAPGKPGAAAPPPPPPPGKPGAPPPPPPPPPPRAPAPKAPPPPPPPPPPPAKPAPAAPPMAPAPKPAAPKPPTAPPLLTETIQKMFNINFNWNRNLQPKAPPAPAPAPPMPAPKAPPAAPPAAPPPPPPKAPPAPPAPPAAPPAPAPGPKGPPTKAPPTKYYQDLQENDYVDYPDRQQQIIYYPDENESLNQDDTKEIRNNYGFPEAIQQYWTQSPWNKNNIQYNLYTPAPDYQEFNTPDGGKGYHVRHYHRNDHLQQQEQPNEEQHQEQQQETPENKEQPQQEQYQQPQQEQYQQPQQEQYQQPQQEQYQQPQQEQYQQPQQEQYQQQQPEQQQYEQNNEDVSGDDSKSSYNYNNQYQPRGFQPVYSGSESRYQSNFYQPGLPLQVHGIQEDKVLVAWPSPFEIAGSEKKNKVTPYTKQFGDRIQSSGSENQEYKYEPESYGQYNFYTIPPPTKYQYEKYDAPIDPKIEKELSPNAKVSEKNYSNKYTNVNTDQNTYNH